MKTIRPSETWEVFTQRHNVTSTRLTPLWEPLTSHSYNIHTQLKRQFQSFKYTVFIGRARCTSVTMNMDAFSLSNAVTLQNTPTYWVECTARCCHMSAVQVARTNYTRDSYFWVSRWRLKRGETERREKAEKHDKNAISIHQLSRKVGDKNTLCFVSNDNQWFHLVVFNTNRRR
jgi:hypothetical protein